VVVEEEQAVLLLREQVDLVVEEMVEIQALLLLLEQLTLEVVVEVLLMAQLLLLLFLETVDQVL
jgi:hypothetical protein